jgi:hypothetical protein
MGFHTRWSFLRRVSELKIFCTICVSTVDLCPAAPDVSCLVMRFASFLTHLADFLVTLAAISICNEGNEIRPFYKIPVNNKQQLFYIFSD